MLASEIMIRYGELSTKGKNMKDFINRLGKNVAGVLEDYSSIEVNWNRDRMHVILNDQEEHSADIINRLTHVFGISSLSPAMKVEKTLKAAEVAVQDLARELYEPNMTFKIDTHRADHEFEYDTMALNRKLGAAVIDAIPEIQAQMDNPDIKIRVEVRNKHIYISARTIPGAGGMPVGTAGTGMLMLSGGIDSPVAGYLSMKRGMEVEAVHFHSPPYTSPQALQKAKDLAAKIAQFSGPMTFIEVPFAEIQEEIKKHVPDGYGMTITRRMMLRLTDKIREQQGGLAIVTGESMGQVASQTLESMQAINHVTTTPVLRPLISMDKNEIIDITKTIDTYELSIQPFEDCCTIFAPSSPKTKPTIENAIRYEKALDIEGLIERALAGVKRETIKPGSSQDDALEETFNSIL